MSEELSMTPEGIRKFLHNQSISRQLLKPGVLAEKLEKIFNKYISNERIARTIREEAVRTWNHNRDEQIGKINEAVTLYLFIECLEGLRPIELEVMVNMDNDMHRTQETMRAIERLIQFVSQKWPDDPTRGLSREETIELRAAIGYYVMAQDNLERMLKRYGKFNDSN